MKSLLPLGMRQLIFPYSLPGSGTPKKCSWQSKVSNRGFKPAVMYHRPCSQHASCQADPDDLTRQPHRQSGHAGTTTGQGNLAMCIDSSWLQQNRIFGEALQRVSRLQTLGTSWGRIDHLEIVEIKLFI